MNARGPLPVAVTAALLRAMQAVAHARTPWPVIDEEAWWRDVLCDPRARRPTEKRLDAKGRWAYLRLDRFRNPIMRLACARSGLRKEFDYEDVLQQFGGDYRYRRAAAPARALQIPDHARRGVQALPARLRHHQTSGAMRSADCALQR
jgi:hypothetical protein